MQERVRKIVCGVGDSGSPAAVDFAAGQASRLGAELLLVRVALQPPSDRAGATHEATTTAEAPRLVDEARARALAAHPGLVVTHQLADTDWVAGGLTAAAEPGTLLVLEQSARGRLRRLVTGSTTDGVASRSRAPVVVVPPGWNHDDAPTVVTVAVQDLDEAPHLVEAAFEEAARGSAEVHVLHALWLLGGYDLSEEVQRTWTDRWTSDLAPVVDALGGSHPDVKARVDVVVSSPSGAIVDASRASHLLVMGRHHRAGPWGSHVGPVAHRVLLESACPVLLLPAEVTSPAAGTPAPRARRSEACSVQPGDVVVGIGGGGAAGAVSFGAQEARRRGAGLHVVRVVPVPPVATAGSAAAREAELDRGRRDLAEAVGEVDDSSARPHRVEAHLLSHGTVPRTLLEHAEPAAVLVVEHRRLTRFGRLVSHSVTNAVASRRDGLVVAVPEGWSPSSDPGRVIVALADPDQGDDVLRTGIAEALRWDVPLVVAHSTWVSSDPEGPLLPPSVIRERARRARAALDAATGLTLAAVPGLESSTVVEHHAPVDLLTRLATPDDVLVVEARRHAWGPPSHLGPVTRGLLAHASCPVLLAPARGRPRGVGGPVPS